MKSEQKSGMVFQQFNLFPHMRVLENITVAPKKVRNMNSEDADELAHQLLEKVGLAIKQMHIQSNYLAVSNSVLRLRVHWQ